MAGGHVAVLTANFLFDFSDSFRKEFNRGAALGANHMVMASAVVLVLIPGDAVVKSNLTGKAAASQKFQSPVDGSDTDPRIGFLHQSVQFIDRKMLPSLKESAQNGASLPSLLQSDTAQMLKKNPLSLAHVLLRNGRLIVDSLLQHSGQG